MNQNILTYHTKQTTNDKAICSLIASLGQWDRYLKLIPPSIKPSKEFKRGIRSFRDKENTWKVQIENS